MKRPQVCGSVLVKMNISIFKVFYIIGFLLLFNIEAAGQENDKVAEELLGLVEGRSKISFDVCLVTFVDSAKALCGETTSVRKENNRLVQERSSSTHDRRETYYFHISEKLESQSLAVMNEIRSRYSECKEQGRCDNITGLTSDASTFINDVLFRGEFLGIIVWRNHAHSSHRRELAIGLIGDRLDFVWKLSSRRMLISFGDSVATGTTPIYSFGVERVVH